MHGIQHLLVQRRETLTLRIGTQAVDVCTVTVEIRMFVVDMRTLLVEVRTLSVEMVTCTMDVRMFVVLYRDTRDLQGHRSYRRTVDCTIHSMAIYCLPHLHHIILVCHSSP